MQKCSNIYVGKGCKYTSAAVSVSCIVIKKNLQISHTNTDAVARRCSVKKVFLEISQNSQENICTRVSVLIKVFSCEFCEISKNTFSNRTPFLTEHLWWLLLPIPFCLKIFQQIHFTWNISLIPYNSHKTNQFENTFPYQKTICNICPTKTHLFHRPDLQMYLFD